MTSEIKKIKKLYEQRGFFFLQWVRILKWWLLREGFARHNTESTDALSSFRQSPPEKSEVMPASVRELLSVIPGLRREEWKPILVSWDTKAAHSGQEVHNLVYTLTCTSESGCVLLRKRFTYRKKKRFIIFTRDPVRSENHVHFKAFMLHVKKKTQNNEINAVARDFLNFWINFIWLYFSIHDLKVLQEVLQCVTSSKLQQSGKYNYLVRRLMQKPISICESLKLQPGETSGQLYDTKTRVEHLWSVSE